MLLQPWTAHHYKKQQTHHPYVIFPWKFPPEVCRQKLILCQLLVAPDRVEIQGPETAKVGQTLNFECATSNSNPASTLHWEIDGRVTRSGTDSNLTSEAADGGWLTSANTSVTIRPNDKTKTISCYAKNAALGETKVETHIVTVLCEYPFMDLEQFLPAPWYFLRPSSIQAVIFVYIPAHLYSLSQNEH